MLKPSADAEEVAKKTAEGQVVLANRINLARGLIESEEGRESVRRTRLTSVADRWDLMCTSTVWVP
jgi:hypothetical protein